MIGWKYASAYTEVAATKYWKELVRVMRIRLPRLSGVSKVHVGYGCILTRQSASNPAACGGLA